MCTYMKEGSEIKSKFWPPKGVVTSQYGMSNFEMRCGSNQEVPFILYVVRRTRVVVVMSWKQQRNKKPFSDCHVTYVFQTNYRNEGIWTKILAYTRFKKGTSLHYIDRTAQTREPSQGCRLQNYMLRSTVYIVLMQYILPPAPMF